MGDNGGYVAGVETCGSVWVCPVCAAKISEGRRKDVAECLDAHVMTAGNVFMGLFTIPHHYEESCAALRDTVSGAWSKFIAGKAWKDARRRFGITGYIRALEVTHGKNGWHPHIHTLFLTRHLASFEVELLRIWLAERWATIVKRISGKTVNVNAGFGFQKACSISAAGDYVAKWGVDSEIAKAGQKVSRKGGRSPWQLLADAQDGDHAARMAFREYGLAMKGARHLTWSNGLRALYLETPEKDDFELAKMDAPFKGDEVVGVLRRHHWFKVYSMGLVPDVISAAEQSGWSGVLQLLRAHKLALPEGAIYVRQWNSA